MDRIGGVKKEVAVFVSCRLCIFCFSPTVLDVDVTQVSATSIPFLSHRWCIPSQGTRIRVAVSVLPRHRRRSWFFCFWFALDIPQSKWMILLLQLAPFIAALYKKATRCTSLLVSVHVPRPVAANTSVSLSIYWVWVIQYVPLFFTFFYIALCISLSMNSLVLHFAACFFWIFSWQLHILDTLVFWFYIHTFDVLLPQNIVFKLCLEWSNVVGR